MFSYHSVTGELGVGLEDAVRGGVVASGVHGIGAGLVQGRGETHVPGLVAGDGDLTHGCYEFSTTRALETEGDRRPRVMITQRQLTLGKLRGGKRGRKEWRRQGEMEGNGERVSSFHIKLLRLGATIHKGQAKKHLIVSLDQVRHRRQRQSNRWPPVIHETLANPNPKRTPFSV